MKNLKTFIREVGLLGSAFVAPGWGVGHNCHDYEGFHTVVCPKI